MSFIFNLFSPRKQASNGTDENAAAAKMEEDMKSDPLSKFFCAADAEMPVDNLRDAGGADAENAMSYAEWKISRKQFLMNYLERRLIGGGDESSREEQHLANKASDDGSFCSDVMDEDFDSEENAEDSTDSQYVKNGINQWIANWKQRGWKTADKKPVKNIDLWQQLDELVARHTVKWHWVKGHSGHAENERADALANKGIDELTSKT